MSRFIDAFPVPRFLAMPAVGLSIADEAVRFVQFDLYRNKIRLSRFGKKPLPKNTVCFGEIKDAPVLIDVLKELQKEYSLSFVRTALPEEKAYLFDTTIPDTKDTKLRDAVAFKIEENVPLPVNQVLFGFHVIGEEEDQAGNKNLDVAVSAYPADVVSMYTEVLQTAGLRPISFEIESQAITRAVVKKHNAKDLLIINIRPEKTEFYIVSGDLVRFSSTATIGTTNLFKNQDVEGEVSTEAMPKADPALEEQSVKTLISEAEKLFSYWHTEKHSGSGAGTLESVIVCGPGSAHGRLIRLLANNLKVPAVAGNVWQNAFSLDEYVPPITFNNSIQYTSAIGLALPEGDYYNHA